MATELEEFEYETVEYAVEGGVAYVTLNRPEVLNAFNRRMQDELSTIWRGLRREPEVGCAVLTAAGDRAFCTGIDRTETMGEGEQSSDSDRTARDRSTPVHFDDPGKNLGPKSNDLWTPVIAAVNGMAAGGAFYMLGEVDFIIASEHATFFDPHVTYGMAAVFESMLMLQRMPLGEVLRMQLLGNYERMSAQRAHQIGLVSEVVAGDELLAAARRVAESIASQPAQPVRATVRSIWTALELSRQQALEQGYAILAAGSSREAMAQGQQAFASGKRVEWRLR